MGNIMFEKQITEYYK